jgi:CRP/FNR family cyclic AMP-dependent transcriptional regulator
MEDPLSYLPCSMIMEYSKGHAIYGIPQVSNYLYLVIDGAVKVYYAARDGRQIVVDVYVPDEFFGESVFLGERRHEQEAVALEATKVMAWSMAEIEASVVRRPRLALALIQFVVRRSVDFAARVESQSTDSMDRRLVRALIGFAQRMGKPCADGFAVMMPFTHELLAQYLGTSRELVTHYMNLLRNRGYLRYSRQDLAINCEMLSEWLKSGAPATG